MKSIILPDIVAAGIYNAQITHKNKTITPIRKTTMFEIELPLDNGGISYINDTAHPITENTVICAKPGQSRHTKLPFKCYYIHIIVGEGDLFDLLSSLPDFFETADVKDIKETFTALCESYNNGSSKEEILTQSLLLNLIYTIDKKAESYKRAYQPKSSNRKVIEQTIQYIKNNISDELSLESLSERANFSPIYFHKLFKASTGRNLRSYIEEQRIKKAIVLLTSTAKTLTQIAYECGFSSQSYFSYAFKRKTGLTPREYAKKLQSKYEDVK
ncbi:MAG: helix-turn-helix transcriptional regulator [Ruminococcaceae bacterium]|nr:helix-turn-helix transcriptional regulator [Oscillospiraceae bacterium]